MTFKIDIIKNDSCEKTNCDNFPVFFSCVIASAQNEHKDYFIGKWDVMVYKTPSGDKRMILELKRINGKLSGAIVSQTDDIKRFKKIEETPNSVKVYFKHMIFTVNLLLKKKTIIIAKGYYRVTTRRMGTNEITNQVINQITLFRNESIYCWRYGTFGFGGCGRIDS